MKLLYLALVSLMIVSCRPEPVAPKCDDLAIIHLNDYTYTGHITLCNAQGDNLIYEPGTCKISLEENRLIAHITSSNPNYIYNYKDTIAYNCVIWETYYRYFELIDVADNSEIGIINDKEKTILISIFDENCPNSSLFEADN